MPTNIVRYIRGDEINSVLSSNGKPIRGKLESINNADSSIIVGGETYKINKINPQPTIHSDSQGDYLKVINKKKLVGPQVYEIGQMARIPITNGEIAKGRLNSIVRNDDGEFTGVKIGVDYYPKKEITAELNFGGRKKRMLSVRPIK